MPRRPSNLATPAQLAQILGQTPRRTRRHPERYFTDQVKRYAKRGGWLAYHNLHAQGSDPGFLDLTMIRFPRLIVAELKIPPNTTTDWQDVWLGAWRLLATLAVLARCPLRIEVYEWTPDDWPEIEAVLT